MNRFNQSPLELLQTSLQLEFEYHVETWSPDKKRHNDILKAKKRQLELLKALMNQTITIQLAKRVDKPVIGWERLMRLKPTTPSIHD